MTATDLVLIALVLTAMAVVAAVDARRAIVDPRLVLALVGSGLLWRLFGPVETGPLWSAGLGAALGVAVVAVPIAVAQLCRRRWPLFPGDAMMLGGLGFVLGPLALGWSLLAGAILASLYRAWLQRRRGRSFFRGYCPLGPGMAAGAMAVFVFVNAGGALAADEPEIPLPQQHPALQDAVPPTPPHAPSRRDATAAASETSMLAASELAPVSMPLPSSLAARAVAIDEPEPLAFAAVTERIATLAGVPVEVEERPSRVAGGAVRLPDPPRVRLAFEGALPGLLNLVAERTGYDWAYRSVLLGQGDPLDRRDPLEQGDPLDRRNAPWAEGGIVFYRYHDVEQRMPGMMRATAGGQGAAVGHGGDETAVWRIDRKRHATLRAVLKDWGARAGWSVVWVPRRDYAVRADAVFEGGFLDAVDGLLAAPATRRSLVALAYEPNRHLVIEPAGGVR